MLGQLRFDIEREACDARARGLRAAGLFSGIGGLELGLERAGHRAGMLCEVDERAGRVLRARFPRVPLIGDVRAVKALPSACADIVTAGFPCQDLSQAGRAQGIDGKKSGLVREVFRLIDRARPRWLLLENVPFMLRLERGRGMAFLAVELSARGYSWAYRTVDARAWGIPQRRRRVLLLASRTDDPRAVLFADDAGEPALDHPFADRMRGSVPASTACGFYWTEGARGLGWAVDCVPTIKGGSGIGIPSPPAILMPDGSIGTPDIRDAERLQGFPEGFTAPAEHLGARWRMVGNAVCVPMAEWIGRRLLEPGMYTASGDERIDPERWPDAAWCMRMRARAIEGAAACLSCQRFGVAGARARRSAGLVPAPSIEAAVGQGRERIPRADKGRDASVPGRLPGCDRCAYRTHGRSMKRTNAIRRVEAIMNFAERHDDWFTNSDVLQTIDCCKHTVGRYTATLSRLRYLEQRGSTKARAYRFSGMPRPLAAKVLAMTNGSVTWKKHRKLSAENIVEACWRAWVRKETVSAIAKRFGVRRNAILSLFTGRSHRDLVALIREKHERGQLADLDMGMAAERAMIPS